MLKLRAKRGALMVESEMDPWGPGCRSLSRTTICPPTKYRQTGQTLTLEGLSEDTHVRKSHSNLIFHPWDMNSQYKRLDSLICNDGSETNKKEEVFVGRKSQ